MFDGFWLKHRAVTELKSLGTSERHSFSFLILRPETWKGKAIFLGSHSLTPLFSVSNSEESTGENVLEVLKQLFFLLVS